MSTVLFYLSIGAVSVQQQLQIIGRMSRTYPFLKVIGSGTTFHARFISSR